MNKIITIDREFGSGGRELGRSFYPVADPVLEQTMAVYQEQSRIIKKWLKSQTA